MIFVLFLKVADLFGEHPDLLNEFTHFLPDTSAVATAQHGSSARTLLHGFKFNSPVQVDLEFNLCLRFSDFVFMLSWLRGVFFQFTWTTSRHSCKQIRF